jgi:hypothetical protein
VITKEAIKFKNNFRVKLHMNRIYQTYLKKLKFLILNRFFLRPNKYHILSSLPKFSEKLLNKIFFFLYDKILNSDLNKFLYFWLSPNKEENHKNQDSPNLKSISNFLHYFHFITIIIIINFKYSKYAIIKSITPSNLNHSFYDPNEQEYF